MLPPDFDAEEDKVEKTLLVCAAQINQLHLEGTSSESSSSPRTAEDGQPAAIFRDKENQAETQTDKFAANAGTLFHRFNKQVQSRRNVDSSDDTEMGASHYGNSKKKRKQSAYTIESMENFRKLIASNKDYTCHYIRTTLFCLIIPATGVACL